MFGDTDRGLTFEEMNQKTASCAGQSQLYEGLDVYDFGFRLFGSPDEIIEDEPAQSGYLLVKRGGQSKCVPCNEIDRLEGEEVHLKCSGAECDQMGWGENFGSSPS